MKGKHLLRAFLVLPVPGQGRPASDFLTGRVHHVGAKTSLLPLPGNQVRGTSPPNLFPLDLEEQCHGFRPVVVVAEVVLDDYR